MQIEKTKRYYVQFLKASNILYVAINLVTFVD